MVPILWNTLDEAGSLQWHYQNGGIILVRNIEFCNQVMEIMFKENTPIEVLYLQKHVIDFYLET